MTDDIDFEKIETKELAGLICQNFRKDNIEAILVGGSCVTIYSNNRYMSADLDYVTYEALGKVEKSLNKLGFVKKGKYFVHPKCKFYIDFVSEPVAIGNEIIRKFQEMPTKFGNFTLLLVSDCVKDRLASFYYWNDKQGLNQAIEVCLDHMINLKKIRAWSKKEGFEEKFFVFENQLKHRKKELSKQKKLPLDLEERSEETATVISSLISK